MSKYGYLKGGVVIALNDAAGYAATDETVKNLWIQVPEATVVGSTKSGSAWTHPDPASSRRTQISPVEFKMMFTSQERIAIRLLREAENPDLVIDDWWDILDDPRLTMVDLSLQQAQDGLTYLVQADILTDERKAEITAGLPA